MTYKVTPVRESVGILVWNKDEDKILAVTNRKFGKFSSPGGKIELGEYPAAAAFRELKEETGLRALKLDLLISLGHKPVANDPKCVPWFCHYFLAEVGDQIPQQVEKGTIPVWVTVEDMLTKSLYPRYYSKIFKALEII